MSDVIFREEAEKDVGEVTDYLGERNLEVAKRFLIALKATTEQLAKLHGMGSPRDYGNPRLAGMRMRPIRGFENYLVFYIALAEGIEVVRVLHGSRDLDSLFGTS